ILTFAKGEEGQSALDRAFAIWNPRPEQSALAKPIKVVSEGVARCAVLKAGLAHSITLRAGPGKQYRPLGTVTSVDYLKLTLDASQVRLWNSGLPGPWLYVSAAFTFQASETISGWLRGGYLKEVACASP